MWEAERSFDGKLCQEYLHQKLLESDNFFWSYNQKCWGFFFETQCTLFVMLINSLLMCYFEGIDVVLPILELAGP